MINIYCPTDEQEQHTKESFYQQLEIVYDNAPKNDIKVIMGDMNAKIGKEPQFYGTTGKHSLHNETSENGEFVINFATSKNMVISSTCFPHKDIHKMTWISPDGTTTNQIDHVMIDKRAASSISDVRTRRGACCGSDHLLLQTKFRCRVNRERNERQQRTNKLDLEKLKTQECREKFEQEVTNELRTQELHSIESKWNNIKTAVLTAAASTVGNKKKKRRGTWFDDECRQAIEERNEAHKMYITRRTRERRTSFEVARRKADKICRNKKRAYENGQIEEMEQNFKKNEIRGAYEYLKKIKSGYKPQTSLCKDESGQIISDQQKVTETWKHYFQTLLGTQVDMEDEMGTNHVEENEVEVEAPTIEEVLEAIKAQKNNKAPGFQAIQISWKRPNYLSGRNTCYRY